MANINVCCVAMTPEASGASSTEFQRENMLASIRRVGLSLYGENCRFDSATGYLYACRDPKYRVYSPQYVRYLVRTTAVSPHTIVIVRSLLDVSADIDTATRVLMDLRSRGTVDEVFVSDISEQTPFVDYAGYIRRYYGLPETMKPLRLRTPENIVACADRMSENWLPFSDISEVLLTTKSQIQAYRKSKNLGRAYTFYLRTKLSEKQRAQLREECRVVIAREFDACFSSIKLDLL